MRVASMEIEFGLDMAGAVAAAASLSQTVGSTSASAVREFNKIEREAEKLTASIGRQASEFGKNAQELRGMKVESAAMAAEQRGMVELAERLRTAEAALFEQELAAARAVRFAAEAAEEAKLEAAAASAREAKELRDAAAAHALFEARVREGVRALKEQEAAQAKRDREAEAARERAAAEAAVNAQLLERSRLQAVIERNTGDGRMAATDNGATYSALAARAAEDEARANALAAAETKRLADEHERLAAMVRGSAAAQEADVVAAERLRSSTDPLYAATKRLNEEIAESTRLYHVGATAPEEYARQQQVLTGRLREFEQANDAVNAAGRKGTGTLTQLSFQANDVATMWMSGASAGQIFATQAGQVLQVAQMAEGGVAGFGKELLLLTVRYAPLIGVMSVAGVALNRWTDDLNDAADMDHFVAGLGLTRQEVKRLGDQSIDVIDVLKGLWKTISDGVDVDGKKIIDYLFSPNDAEQVAGFVASIYGTFVGGYRAIVDVWDNLPEALGDAFIQSVNAAIRAINDMVKSSIDGINGLAKRANDLLGIDLFGQIADAPKIAEMANQYAGALAAVANAGHHVTDATKEAMDAQRDFIAQVGRNTIAIKQQTAAQKAADMITDRAAKKPRMSDEERARQAAIKEALRFIQALEDETAKIGLNEKQVREWAVAQAAAKAPTDELRQAIKAAGAARENTYAAQAPKDFIKNVIEPLEFENSLLRLNAEERALATAARDAEAAGIAKGSAEWERYMAAVRASIDPAEALNEQLRQQIEALDLIEDRVRSAADVFADAFGDIGQSIGDAASALVGYATAERRLQEERDVRLATAHDQAEIDRINARYAEDMAFAQVRAYGDMASAAKSFFKEGSTGYEVLGAAEKAFRAYELAMAVKNAAVQLGLIGSTTAAKVAGNVAGAASAVAASATEIAAVEAVTGVKAVDAVINAIRSLPFPLNIAAGAATAAVVASLGFAVAGAFGGGGGNPNSYNEGKGTVFGDDDAQSKSIENAIAALQDVDRATMRYSARMADSLDSIEANIGGLVNILIRTGNINASAGVDTGFKTDGLGTAISTVLLPLNSVLKEVPILGDIVGGLTSVVKSLFGTKTKVVASGIFAAAQQLQDIIDSGFDASYFSDVKKTKKFFGISTGSKYSTEYADASNEIEAQFGLILKGFYDAIGAAAGPLGLNLDEVEGKLDGFVVDIGKIDLQGLSGEEIQEKLTAVFGAAADDMANIAIPGLEKFQQVGEGYFETLIRYASEVEAVSNRLQMMGFKDLRTVQDQAVLKRFDDIEQFRDATTAYMDSFMTDAERAAAQAKLLAPAFEDLGFAMPKTAQGFRDLVEAQDITTQSGKDTWAELLKLAPAFAEVVAAGKSLEEVAREEADLTRQLWEIQGETNKIREAELKALDPGNRELQKRIWALQDEAKAAAQLEALGDTNRGIREQIAALTKSTADDAKVLKASREDELEGVDKSTAALLKRLWALQDEAAATEKAKQAAAEHAAALETLGDTNRGLRQQIAELTGNTKEQARLLKAARDDELEGVDASTAALMKRLWALQDEAAATEKAKQAAAEHAAALETLGDTNRGLRQQIAELTGNTKEQARLLKAARDDELEGVDASTAALMKRLWALQDEAAATEKAKQAAAEHAAALETLGDTNRGLRQQIAELTGNTKEQARLLKAARDDELEGVDASTAALMKRLWALQDEAAATEKAKQAAEELAAKQKAIADERDGLQRRMLELAGDTAAIRALDLAKLDASNRALQLQIWAIEDAKAAAEAAEQLREAWRSVGDTIMDEVRRIRGEVAGGESFAVLQGRFNAATAAARGGDQAAAGTLPELSRAMIEAAGLSATSRQEFDRVRGQTASSLEQTVRIIDQIAAGTKAAQAAGTAPIEQQSWWTSFQASQAAVTAANDAVADKVEKLTAELKAMRADMNRGNATIAGNTGKVARKLDDVTGKSGGNAISTVAA
ncbi:hypothetical protein [Sphingomonas sp. ID0503]|uniref:hypothetical protein n=1 Tax=Sphingomonas sp. ID0503 TaxID=3399691 RepID=UPI003AFA7CF9